MLWLFCVRLYIGLVSLFITNSMHWCTSRSRRWVSNGSIPVFVNMINMQSLKLSVVSESSVYACKFHIWLPITAHGLWEWFIILTLFVRLTYVNVLHWIVRLYYYGFLVNEGIALILVIQPFYPPTLSVLYNKNVYPTSSIV